MQEHGVVSVWVGMSDSLEVLEEALTDRFEDLEEEDEDDEDDGWTTAPFMEGFEIEDYDPTLLQVDHFEAPRSGVPEMLRGVALEEKILPAFELDGEPRMPVDSRVVYFNYRHDGPKEWRCDGVHMFFLGSAEIDGLPKPY